MKPLVITLLSSLFLFGLLQSEGLGQQTIIEEQFFGSNSTSYALLRTETMLSPAGEKIRSRTWLDEYTKVPTLLYNYSTKQPYEEQIQQGVYGSKLSRSVLLLDTSHNQKNHKQPTSETQTTEKRNVHTQERTTTISKLLLRYPCRSLKPWPAEHAAQLRHSDESLFISFKGQVMVNGKAMRTHMGGLDMGDTKAKSLIGSRTVDQVADDNNCTYLTVTARSEQKVQTRIFCMVPPLADNLHALWTREPLYLTTGLINEKEEALHLAKEMRGKLIKEKAWSAVGVEVWSFYNSSYSRRFFCVAISDTMDLIKRRQVRALSELLDMQFVPMPSGTFAVSVQKFP
ncbi:hypothetical protein HW115_10085 [Verrucomicrobiaceae bacterium N1E253]|uniref:Uncharacterized protein n=1 Tax=Oceaniferula marina TaxID=2748318 RepID=A0A851GGD1_9BACT|nr:hypothetical protein [Oceaniferula marina]NWK55962.1 hypothetical protein [Oceaniferula marina]